MRKQPKATRLAFILKDELILEKEYTFDYFSGFSIQQKQRTIYSMHKEITKDSNKLNILEVSRKSGNILGNYLSAFNLKVTIDSGVYPVECVYQSSKVYNNQKQLDLLQLKPAEAKKTANEYMKSNNLEIVSFNLFGEEFPIFPSSLFYDYLYILALSQNKSLGREVLKYNCFTDIEFNHKKQISSQARSCAIYNYLIKTNSIEAILKEPLKLIDVYEKNIVKDKPTLL